MNIIVFLKDLYMPSSQEARTRNIRKFIPAVYASAAAALLAGQVQEVRAGVFEQTCNGKVVDIGSGALSGASLPYQAHSTGGGRLAAPTSIIELSLSSTTDASDVPAGAIEAADASLPSSICADPPVGTTNYDSTGLEVIKRLKGQLRLPEPNRLSRQLSDGQVEMRELAADVGLRFAQAPGVRKAKLDTPAFIKLFTTLVHRESSFKPRAVSPAGARGLGQLMPATARSLGVKDSFSPNENLVGAATYLTEMLDRFGSPELALAAYNAGPGAVEKHNGIPPYRETRQYVADIFHEVLREPRPLYVTARLTPPVVQPDLDAQLAALTAEAAPAAIDKDRFATVLTGGTPQTADVGAGIKPTAFTAVAETATVMNASFKVAQGSKAGVTADADPRPKKTKTPSAKTEEAPERVMPVPPDLKSLPEPRAFLGTLSKSQLAMRDLAADVGLRYSGAPAVEKAGLSEAAFVTLFVALIRRESSFNRTASSPTGAKGLGQLLPETVRALAIKDPFSAGENLDGSAKHFSRLLEEFGSPALALAAYNAGPAIVREKAGMPDERKTRQFVADVLHDIKSDPRPDYIVARLNKRADALLAASARAGKNDAIDGTAGGDVARSGSGQASGASGEKWRTGRPVLAASVNPFAFSSLFSGGLTTGKIFVALGVAFVITLLCSAVAESSQGQGRTPAWKRALDRIRRRPRPVPADGGSPLAVAACDASQDASGGQAGLPPAAAHPAPQRMLRAVA